MANLPFALQLYTVRDHMAKDLETTLRRVREIGYAHVEIGDLLGKTPMEFRALLESAGLEPVSMHFGFEQVLGDLGQVVDAVRTMGVRYAVISWMAFDSEEGWRSGAKMLDDAGARLRQHGLRLCYHNHAHEFETYDGDYALDILLQGTSEDHLALQLDICWANVGGADPVRLLQKYCGRVPLIHVKDYRMQDSQFSFAEVGCGCTDWTPILDAARSCGVEWYIVEQDESARDSLESARISAERLVGYLQS